MISRHFATIGGTRQVHYRRAGQGSPVVLLNQSPKNSAEYIPLIKELARDYTVIAPDTPGNGLSDPLQIERPAMGDFADAVVALFDELGIEKAPVYGYHTGGLCALELARRHPDRVVVTITNGYLHMEPEAIEQILENYFAELTLDWTGSHLTWIWSRMRGQFIFFPWFQRKLNYRMDYAMPPPESVHEQVMEILQAGDNYRGPYRAAFLFSAAEAIQQATAPAVVMTSKEDVLHPGMALMPKPADSVRVLEPETHADTQTLIPEILAEHDPQPEPAFVATAPIEGRIWSRYTPVEGGYLYTRLNTDADGRPIVFQHASSGSNRSSDALMQHFIGKRPVIAFDLPGNGDSDKFWSSKDVSVEAQAKVLAEAIRAAGLNEVDFYGEWGAGTVGVELAVREPDLVKHVVAPNLILLDDATREKYLAHYTPDIDITEDGSHFNKVWTMVHDQQVYAPWFEKNRDNVVRSHEPELSPEILHRRTLDLLKCKDIYQASYAAHFNYPVREKLPRVGCPLLLGKSATSDAATGWGVPQLEVRTLPGDDRAALAAELLAFFAA